MKLLAILPSIASGGAEQYALTIAAAAEKKGWEVYAAFCRRDETTSLIRAFSDNGVNYHPLAIGESASHDQQTKRRQFMRVWRTLRTLRKVKPDVVLIVLPTIQIGLGPMMACALRRIPSAVVFQYVQQLHPFKGRHLRAYHWARKRGQQLVAISENNRQLVADSFHVPISEISLINNGAKINLVPSLVEKRMAIRKRIRQDLHISEACPVLLTVAALRPQKGYEYLIPTIPHILKESPNACWVWVGEGQLREELIELLRIYGVEDAVLFLGQRDDVPALLCAADLFVFPTRFEGQPFALLEAMAAGLPVVTTNASGIPEVVTHMEHGVVCRKEDSCDLLESIRYALRDPVKMREMACNAQLRVKEFSEEKMVKQTLTLLHSCKSSYY